MERSTEAPYGAHLRSIRSAISALAVAVLAQPLLMADEYYGFFLFLVTLVLIVHSFVPTLMRS